MKITRILLTLSMIALPLSALRADQAQDRVDKLALDKFRRGVRTAERQAKTFSKMRGKQFDIYIEASLQGTAGEADAVLMPVWTAFRPLGNTMKNDVPNTRAKNLSAIAKRQKGDYKEQAEELLARREAILEDVVTPVRQARRDQDKLEEGECPLTPAVFRPLADELADEIVDNDKLFELLSLKRDRIEDFLFDEGLEIWERLKNGDKWGGVGIVAPRWKKRLRDILRDTFLKGKLHEAESELEKTLEDKGLAERSDFRLLYAYVKLINKHNPNAQEEGFEFLQEVFENERTARVAYNLVRVGARLDKLPDEELWKLVDFAIHTDKTERLANLQNLAMLNFLKTGQDEQAVRLYKQLREANQVDRLIPALTFVVLLRQGEFDRISQEVFASSLRQLMIAAPR